MNKSNASGRDKFQNEKKLHFTLNHYMNLLFYARFSYVYPIPMQFVRLI